MSKQTLAWLITRQDLFKIHKLIGKSSLNIYNWI